MRGLIQVLIILVGFTGAAHAEDRPAEPLEISWEDLLPEGEDAGPGNNVQHDQTVPLFGDMTGEMSGMPPVQYGSFNTVDDLDGKYVKIPGFALALEYRKKGRVDEFLLVPYFGACIHVPPPPPNQIVYVKSDDELQLRGIWDPIWAYGTLRTKTKMNDLGNAAYTLELEKIESYDE